MRELLNEFRSVYVFKKLKYVYDESIGSEFLEPFTQYEADRGQLTDDFYDFND